MDKGCEAGNLLIGKIEVWHALLRASVADDLADLVSIHILGDQLGGLEIRPTLSTTRVPAVTKRAILLKQRVTVVDQGHGVRFAYRRGALPGSGGRFRAAGWCLCSGNGEAHEHGSRQPNTPSQDGTKESH